MPRKGLAFRGQLWMMREFEVLARLWAAGASVPYPVQRLDNEVMLEFIGDAQGAAPRLVHAPDADPASLLDQLIANLRLFTRCGIVHGDLSPYNMLVWQGRLVFIDFPQAVDPVTNLDGLDLLHRDVINALAWFERKGLRCDAGALYNELVSAVFAR